MEIKYDIRINTGEYAGKVIQLQTTLDELEDCTIAEQLLDRKFLKCYCNQGEFEILYRFAQIKHDDDQSHNNTFIGEIGGGLQSKEEIEANAKLVAVAPELLEACQRALQVLKEENIFGQARLLLDVAIKKATS